jgi:Raf kinase inhibitor-like YbhB/YbcL family protein
MVEDGDKQDEAKLDFDSSGEAAAYISLDQARVLALQHARNNRDFYGRYGDMDLVWDVIGADETEDYYEVRLSYRPGGNFRSPGIEQFTIDKTGRIEFRQIVSPPRTSRRSAYLFALGIVVVAAVAIVGGLLATGALTMGDSISSLDTVATPDSTPISAPVVAPTETPEPTSLPRRFRIAGIIVDTPAPPGTPPPQDWRLVTAIRPEGSGSIELSPPKPDQLYFQGDSVELTANCDSGFVRWDGDVPVRSEKTDNPISVIMDKPRVLYAFCVEPAEAAYSAGTALNDAGDYEEAIEKFTEAILLDPQHAPAYSGRGSAYLHTGQSQKAIHDYDEAIRLAPENSNEADDYYNRAFIYQTIGDYQQAIEDFTQAIRLNPAQGYLYESRAINYDELGEEQKANADREFACQVEKSFCTITQALVSASTPTPIPTQTPASTAMPTLIPTPTPSPTPYPVPTQTPTPVPTPVPGPLSLTSSSFAGGVIPSRYTCDSFDLSPPLDWGTLPEGTETLAILMDDPNAAVGTWIHWIVFNIPPDLGGLAEDLPKILALSNGATQGNNSWGNVGYGGPCPSDDEIHNYLITAYALDSSLILPEGATIDQLESGLAGYVLAQGTLTATYVRSEDDGGDDGGDSGGDDGGGDDDGGDDGGGGGGY